jgi:hypothetical protein
MHLHPNPFAHMRTSRDDTPMRYGCNAGHTSAERLNLREGDQTRRTSGVVVGGAVSG